MSTRITRTNNPDPQAVAEVKDPASRGVSGASQANEEAAGWARASEDPAFQAPGVRQLRRA